MDDSAFMCDEIVEETVLANFNEKKATCKTQNFYFTCIFINQIPLLIAVSIYWYLIKHRTKQKHLFPFHETKLNQLYVNNRKWK